MLALWKPWVGACYHATHSSFSRGVSVLVHKSLGFILLDLDLDSEGRYVARHALCDRLELLIVGLYVPLPATLDILQKLTPLMARCPSAGVILAGDFNMTPDPTLDRFNPGPLGVSPLSQWADNYGFTDIWRLRHPVQKIYMSLSYVCFFFQNRPDLYY